MKRFCVAVVEGVLLVAAASAEAEETWSFEMFLGSAYNFPMPLSIHQDGEANINMTAQYDTRPFTGSPYYAWRVGRWTEDRAWELELVHHKVYLRNEPPEVQHFEISHGYNLITINRAWLYRGFILRFGAGMVLAHPETTVRGLEFPEDEGALGLGFFISGPTAQGTAGKRFRLKKGLFATFEAKFTMSYAWIPIQDGDADVPVIAVHALFGLGYEF